MDPKSIPSVSQQDARKALVDAGLDALDGDVAGGAGHQDARSGFVSDGDVGHLWWSFLARLPHGIVADVRSFFGGCFCFETTLFKIYLREDWINGNCRDNHILTNRRSRNRPTTLFQENHRRITADPTQENDPIDENMTFNVFAPLFTPFAMTSCFCIFARWGPLCTE